MSSIIKENPNNSSYFNNIINNIKSQGTLSTPKQHNYGSGESYQLHSPGTQTMQLNPYSAGNRPYYM